jgi:large subunit ribosomal protein L22
MDAVKSASANAVQNFKQQEKDLYISKIIVNEGATLKRHRPISRGRTHPIRKRTTHITVELKVRAEEKAPAKASKKTLNPPTP